MWYDAYSNRKIIIDNFTDHIPSEYIINKRRSSNIKGFKLVDSRHKYINRDESSILDAVDISLNTITDLTIDYIIQPSSDVVDIIMNNPLYNVLPNEFLPMYALALRTFQYEIYYNDIIPYLYNMLFINMYTVKVSKLNKTTESDQLIIDKYIESLPDPDINILMKSINYLHILIIYCMMYKFTLWI